jgi:uncharacterized surface anchored protein
MGKRWTRRVFALTAALVVVSGGAWIGAGVHTALAVTKRNAAGDRLAVPCFQIDVDAGNGEPGLYVQNKCDHYDEVPSDGHVNFSGLAPGDYVLWEYRSPTGYLAGKKVRFIVQAGQTTRLTVEDVAGGARLRITTVDSQTAAKLLNAGFTAFKDAGGGAIGSPIAGGSKGYDGADGVTNIGPVAPGDYALVQGCVPSGHRKAANKEFHFDAGVSSFKVTIRKEK